MPAAYYSWQFNPQLWLGLSVNSPFGLSVNFPDAWAGRNYAAGSSSLTTYNATPSFAYRINDMISIGAGVQIQYAKADFSTGLPVNGAGNPGLAALGNQLNIYGHGWGFGFTAGVTLTPTPTTTIGLGYRSAINQKINGTLTLPPARAACHCLRRIRRPVGQHHAQPARHRLARPAPARHSAADPARHGGMVELEPHRHFGHEPAKRRAGDRRGHHPLTLPFQYKDGWFFSAGAEYQWNDQLAVRGGVGYEKSPITDQVREPGIPDNDRTLAVGRRDL